MREWRDMICDEIHEIMASYDGGEDSTPGGLEHMGDVWRLLRKWDLMIQANSADEANAKAALKAADEILMRSGMERTNGD